MSIKDYTTLEMLKEILRRENKDLAPNKVERFMPAYEFLIEISKNHTASIILYEDDWEELFKYTEAKNAWMCISRNSIRNGDFIFNNGYSRKIKFLTAKQVELQPLMQLKTKIKE